MKPAVPKPPTSTLPQPPASPGRRRWCTLLLGSAAVAAWPALAPRRAQAQAQAQAQAPTAPYAVHDLDWTDPARARPVPVRLYLPAGTGRPRPLVVFSHGIGGSRFGYRWLGTHWASQGWASLHLQHVGSDRSLWGGNPLALISRLQDAATDDEALARVLDLRFALDTLLGSAFAPAIDGARIVAAGHSYGANTTLLAAGARIERAGAAIADPRVRAAIVISAPPFYGQGTPARILGGVTVPSLHVTATDDVIRIPGYFSGADDRIAVYEATGSARKWLAVFEGGAHSMFTDRSGPGGPMLNAQVKAATKELASGFLTTVFDGDAQALDGWPQRHAAIVARYQAPG